MARPTPASAARSTTMPRMPASAAKPRWWPTPRAPEMSATATELVTNMSARKTTRARPIRRTNRRRPRRHRDPPTGGKGSSSGHQGGRKPEDPARHGGPVGPLVIREPVAHAVDGQHVAGLPGRGFDLLANVLHVG